MLAALVVVCGCARKQNVLLITFDTTRADAVGYATGRTGYTPNLDRLAADGTWFSTCVTSQPLTVPAHATIMTGQYPYHHGVRNNGTYVLDRKNVTLAEVLKGAGYVTHAAVSSFVLDSQFGLDQGFDSYDDDLSGGPQQKLFMFREIRADRTAKKAIDWLKGERPSDKPFFMWVHFFDPHADYEAPKDVAAKFPGERYEAEIAFADRELGRILQTLDDLHLRDDTLVVMTSDHGEGLGDHGERTHGIFVYDSTTRVPLLFSGKGVPRGKRIDPVVRTADIAPTIAKLVGIDMPATDGASLAELMDGKASPPRTAYSEAFAPRLNFGWSELRSERTTEARFIDAPKPEFYDHKKDPGELTNLYSAQSLPGGARPLIAQVRKAAADDPFSKGGHRESQLDPETRRKLAALGYVWGEAKSTGPRADPKDRIVYWDRFEQAQSAVRARDYGRALVLIRSVLEVDKDNVIAMSSLANVMAKIGQRAEALALYKRMIELDPSRDTQYLGAAKVLRESGQFKEAEEYARTVIRIQPQNPEGYTAVGDVLLDQNRFQEAEPFFRQALQIDPNSSLAVSGLGNCLNRAGRLREALQVLRKGHEHDPTSEAIAYNLAVVVERLGDAEGATKYYEKTLQLDPDHSMSWNNLGAIHDRSGRHDEAIKCVARARQADPMNLEAAYNLGVLLLRANRPAEAIPNLEDTLRLRPGFAPAAVQRARALALAGRKDEALQAWRALTKASPAAWLAVARLELDLGHEKEARAAVRQAIEHGGDVARQAIQKDDQLRPLAAKR